MDERNIAFLASFQVFSPFHLRATAPARLRPPRSHGSSEGRSSPLAALICYYYYYSATLNPDLTPLPRRETDESWDTLRELKKFRSDTIAVCGRGKLAQQRPLELLTPGHRDQNFFSRRLPKLGTHMYHTQTWKKFVSCEAQKPTGSRPFWLAFILRKTNST